MSTHLRWQSQRQVQFLRGPAQQGYLVAGKGGEIGPSGSVVAEMVVVVVRDGLRIDTGHRLVLAAAAPGLPMAARQGEMMGTCL